MTPTNRELLGQLLLTLVLFGCGDHGGSNGNSPGESPQPQSSCPVASQPISVSAVNSWPDLDAEQYASDQANACASMVYYEMLPWTTPDRACNESHPDACTNAYRVERRAHLHAMVKRHIKTIWSAQNYNAAGPKHWTEAMYRQHIIDFREDALEADPTLQYVAISPGGEPWAWTWSAVLARAQIARAEWPGEFVIADAHSAEASGEPYFGGIHYDWLEVHPCSIEQTYRAIRFNSTIEPPNPPSPILTVTDCGPVLVPGDPTLSEIAREALRLKQPVCFYDHAGRTTNHSAMNSVAAVIIDQSFAHRPEGPGDGRPSEQRFVGVALGSTKLAAILPSTDPRRNFVFVDFPRVVNRSYRLVKGHGSVAHYFYSSARTDNG